MVIIMGRTGLNFRYLYKYRNVSIELYDFGKKYN